MVGSPIDLPHETCLEHLRFLFQHTSGIPLKSSSRSVCTNFCSGSHVTTFGSDKRNGVVCIDQNWLEGDETRGRNWEVSNAEMPNISGTDFHGISLVVETR
jgi:hypothetical protein